MEWAIRKSGFIAKVQRDTRKSNIPVDKLFAMSGVNPNDFTDSVYKMSGFLWTYSPAYFHKHCTDFVNWMSTHAPYLGNDEETLVYSSTVIQYGIPLTLRAVRSKNAPNRHSFRFRRCRERHKYRSRHVSRKRGKASSIPQPTRYTVIMDYSTYPE